MGRLNLDVFAKNLLLFPLYFASFVVPRRRRRVAFGSGQHDFNGNAKYLMLHMKEACPELETAWIAPTRVVRDRVRARGLAAFWKYEPRGFWYCLTAKLYVFNNRPTDINFWTSGRAWTLNLWHGVGLKGLGFNSRSADNRRDFNPRSLYRRMVRPWLYARPTWFLSTGPLMTQHFANAFRIPESRCLELGYPRSDHFFLPKSELDAHLAKFEPPDSLAFARSLAGFEKVVLYMPTYRDSKEDFLAASGIDYARLDAAMRAIGGLFIFKLHPWTKLKLPEPGDFPNLRFAPASSDAYPYLPYTDVLVTDYSSVYYDYLLLAKPIVLFVFDRATYETKERDLILDFDTYTPGPRAQTFDELLTLLTAPTPPPRTADVAEVRRLFWGDYAGRAAEALTNKVRALLGVGDTSRKTS